MAASAVHADARTDGSRRMAEGRRRYALSLLLPDGLRVPDPASRFQPEDVHGPSEVDRSRRLRLERPSWRGRPWDEAVLYELHVGAFTPEGTFRAAIAEAGPSRRASASPPSRSCRSAISPAAANWGYDGVLPYAPDASYGRPEDFKALVEAAHARGIAVLLDVVYNHFGPEGNYLPVYAPDFFTNRHKTPWGDAINYDGPDSRPVRDFFIQQRPLLARGVPSRRPAPRRRPRDHGRQRPASARRTRRARARAAPRPAYPPDPGKRGQRCPTG